MKRRRILAAGLVLAASVLVGGVMARPAAAAVNDIDPAANMASTSWGTNRIDLFAKGVDGNLKHKIYNGRWSAWESVRDSATGASFPITSGPSAISWGPGRIDVVARSVAGNVDHFIYENGAWSKDTTIPLHAITGEPAIASWAVGRLDIVVRGNPDNHVWQMGFDGGQWWGWWDIGGIIDASPTVVSWGPNRLDIFVKASDILFHQWWNGSFSNFEAIASGITSAPVVTSPAEGILDIFVRRANGAIAQMSWASGWTGFTDLGGSSAIAPAVTDWGMGRRDLFIRTATGQLQQRTYSSANNGWGAWSPLTDNSPLVAVPSYTPILARQASPAPGQALGSLEYAYVDNIGRIVHGRQPDLQNALSTQWTVVSGQESYAGPPALTEQADKRLQVSGQRSSGDVYGTVEKTKGGTDGFGPFVAQGGQVGAFPVAPAGQPATPSTLVSAAQTDGSTVLIGQARNGGLWWLKQSALGSTYDTWTSLDMTTSRGAPAVVPTGDGLSIFVRDAAGAVQTATLFPNGTHSAWASLGGTGLTSSPAAVVVPGYRVRLFVRAADGTLLTKMQDANLAWPAAWTSTGTQVGKGTPSAVLSPMSGKIEIVTLGTDGNVYSTGEVTQGSGTWRPWSLVLAFADQGLAATDPTVVTYNDGTRLTWGFVFRDTDQVSRLYTANGSGTQAPSGATVAMAKAGEISAATTADAAAGTGEVRFKPQKLPKPPATQ